MAAVQRLELNGRTDTVSDTQLVSVTDAANSALGSFDFQAHAGKAVRIFLQGFG